MQSERHGCVVALIDPHFLSFIGTVLPNIWKKVLGLLTMRRMRWV